MAPVLVAIPQSLNLELFPNQSDNSQHFSRPPSPIFSLPTELHIHILSLLPLFDQICASKTCALWRTLLLQNKSLQKTRYNPSKVKYIYKPFPQALPSHKFLNIFSSEEISRQFPIRNIPLRGLLLRVENGKVMEYLYQREGDTCYTAGRGKPIGIIPSVFLDEPIIFPEQRHNDISNNTEIIKSTEDSIKILLSINAGPYIFQTRWCKEISCVPNPPSVKEVMESVLSEAHEEINDHWDLYTDKYEFVKNSKGMEDKRHWLTVFLVQDNWRGNGIGRDLMLVLRRTSVYI